MTTMMTELDKALNEVINSISELTPRDLANLLKMVERAYVHVLIEQNLRVNEGTKVAGVSHIIEMDRPR